MKNSVLSSGSTKPHPQKAATDSIQFRVRFYNISLKQLEMEYGYILSHQRMSLFFPNLLHFGIFPSPFLLRVTLSFTLEAKKSANI
jgi:hypothetical protein